MKKLSALLSFLILFTAFNCENEPLEGDFVIEDGTDTAISCEEATQNTVTATANFSGVTPDDTNYTQLCLTYQSALENQIDACGDADGSIQAIIDGLDCTTNSTASILGTWRITSFTSNGVEELQMELDFLGICYWEETYTDTTITDINYSGVDCSLEEVIDTSDYSIVDNIITFSNGDNPLEIIELTETTLKYQDFYTEGGIAYTDIYTYERQ